MTTVSTSSHCGEESDNLTVAFSDDRSSSYNYRYDPLNRLTGVGKITGGSESIGTTLGRRALEHGVGRACPRRRLRCQIEIRSTMLRVTVRSRRS